MDKGCILNSTTILNYTKYSIKGIADHLKVTREMAWENKLALNMMLAHKGESVVMGSQFCTSFLKRKLPIALYKDSLGRLTKIMKRQRFLHLVSVGAIFGLI